MSEYLVIPDSALTYTRQKISQSQWEAEKMLDEKIDTVCTTLTKTFEWIIDDDYHIGANNMGQRGFVSLNLKEI